MKYLELLPAVDVKDGRAVRLVQGELSRESIYGAPLEVALEFQSAGAEWIHLVDLDAAFGRGDNAQLLAQVVGALDIKVELSGGIRDDESLKRAIATGCTRINLGTAALENPEWTSRVIAEYGDLIAVGLDVRGQTLAARGWTSEVTTRRRRRPAVAITTLKGIRSCRGSWTVRRGTRPFAPWCQC